MVVFDMAGTTVDEGNVVYRTLHQAIEKVAPTISFEDVLKSGAGKEKLQAIRDTLLDKAIVLGEEEIQSIFRDFQSSLKEAYRLLEVFPTPNTEKPFLCATDSAITESEIGIPSFSCNTLPRYEFDGSS